MKLRKKGGSVMNSPSEDSMRSMKDSHISIKGERIIASTSEDN